MPVDDPANGREANSGSREVGLVMETLEGSKQLRRVCHVKADAVVSDEVDETLVV